MCGRFTLRTPIDVLLERFQLSLPGFEVLPRYNIAPTQDILVAVEHDNQRKPVLMRWGLIPSWSKDKSWAARMINARQETLSTKPSFRNLVNRRRCLILADGFYEWQVVNGEKWPMYITLPDSELFAMAGLWDTWLDPTNQQTVVSCTIVTRAACPSLRQIHDRMPVILSPGDEELWISHTSLTQADVDQIASRVPDKFEYYKVSKLVNSPRNDTPECILRYADQ